ncbi:MAG: hypothetical protein IJU93_09250 [Lachnospiraceae bacterium]|nr:hypothetical protein [Lachnospiraceae bacterium]
MVIWVKENEMEAFLPLIPEEMSGRVKSGEWFCLGALAEDKEAAEASGDERLAVGVLLFSSEEEISPQNREEALRMAAGPGRPIDLISVSELSKDEFKRVVQQMKQERRHPVIMTGSPRRGTTMQGI